MDRQRIQTPLYVIEAPGIFEKMLVAGQLLRLERMDRAPGEQSFAEVNLFVGFTDEERIEDPESDVAASLIEALWDRYAESETGLGAMDVVEDASEAKERCVLVRLAKTDWRPASGALVWIGIPPASGRHVFARMVLEFDWSQRAIYESLGRGLVKSLEWRVDSIGEGDVKALADTAWSVFDSMDVTRREGIARRYREILGQVVPEPAEPVQPRLLDLTVLDVEALTLEELEASLQGGENGEQSVLLQTRFLPDPIELTLEISMHDSYEFGPGTLAAVKALGRLGDADRPRASELLWDHCKICFDATDYGAGEESGEDFFGIHGPVDAFREAGKATIYIAERLNGGAHDLFALDFYPPWENEHGCSLVVCDGALVGGSDPGGWLGEFEITPADG